jgi:hypothetical protein
MLLRVAGTADQASFERVCAHRSSQWPILINGSSHETNLSEGAHLNPLTEPLVAVHHVVVHDFLTQIYSLVGLITTDLLGGGWARGYPAVLFGSSLGRESEAEELLDLFGCFWSIYSI